MNKGYVANKSAVMAGQTTGSAAVAGMAVIIAQKAGFDLSVTEAVTIMGGLTVVFNSIIKMVEKIGKK
jgi:hypothetical protein